MAFTQTQLDAIETAIASGKRTVQYDGRMVSYGSLDDLIRVRDMIRRELGLVQRTDGITVVATNKGIGRVESGSNSGHEWS